MRRALVTGATSGIGKAIVERLRAEDYHVTAVGRRADKLAALAEQTGCQAAPGDVTDLATMRDILAGAQPDILINNAGIGLGITGLETLTENDLAHAIATNVTAPLQLTQLALPQMKAAGSGHIVNMGSIAGLHTLVSALYGAGKAAVHQFSQNLRYELVGTGIRVTEICPGRVASEFYDQSTGNIEANSIGAAAFRALDPGDVADAVAYALSVPAHVNISTMELLPTAQAVGGVKTGQA
ncbi:MAG: SDR family oxidoreductase [Hyphomicrobiales bacterium]